MIPMHFPGGSDDKESACNAGDLGLIPGSEKSPGEGNGNPLQYSCLENSMDKEPGVLQSMEMQRVGLFHFHFHAISFFCLLRNAHTGLHSDYNNLHSHR